MPEINKHEIRSAEMQEVMSGIPGSFLRWGLFLFFAILSILLTGSYFVKKPEIVSVPVVITTQNPPVQLVAKTGGRIDKLFADEGLSISKDSIVAIIGNTSDFKDIKTLSDFLSGFKDKSDWKTAVVTQYLPAGLMLGELQADYSRFEKGWQELKDYLRQAYVPKKLGLLEEQMQRKTEYNKELAKQKELLIEDLSLAKNSFDRDSTLYFNFKNTYKISKAEYERSRQGYIQKLYSYSAFNVTLINSQSDFLRMKENRLDLQVQFEKELAQYILFMEEALQLLKSSVSIWEEKYLIQSPVSGKITLTNFRNENQVIKAGETLAIVIPDSAINIVVRGFIPSGGFGKIEIGQEVNIKLSGFPYMQYGVLKGRIYSLSQVPGEKGFIADIELTGGMTSTYKEKIRFVHQMEGTADIITAETRLIFKFINPLKTIFGKN